MEFELEIEKKHLIALVFIFLILGLTVAYAFGGTAPTSVGHSAGEVEVLVGGVTKTLQQSIDDRTLSKKICRLVLGSETSRSSINSINCAAGEVVVGAGVKCEAASIHALIFTSVSSLTAECDSRNAIAYAFCCKI